MKKLILFLVGTILLNPVSSYADSFVVPPDFPKSLRLDTGSNGVRECFDLSNYKLLLRLKVDFDELKQNVDFLNDSLTMNEQIVIEQSTIIAAQKTTIETLGIQNTRLNKMWEQENLKRLQLETEPNFGSWLSWGLVVVTTIGAAVLAGMYIAK